MSEISVPPAPAPEAVDASEDRLGEACAACGERLAGAYCHACGERRPSPDDESIGHFLREQFHEVTSADGKMWRTLRSLFVPGKLTDEYFSGRRGLYLRPIRLFLVANVLFFILLGVTGGQAFRGDTALYRNNPTIARELDRAAAAAGVEPAVYDAAFSQRADTLAATLIVVFVPLYAALFALVLLPLRSSLVRHVVFATHVTAVFMAVTILIAGTLLVLSAMARAMSMQSGLDNFDPVLVPIALLALITYLVVGIRRVYGAPWWGAALTGLVLGTVGTAIVIQLFQVVLFYVTFWTVKVPA